MHVDDTSASLCYMALHRFKRLLQSGRTVNLSSSIDVDSEPTSEKDEGSCDLWTGDEFSDSEEIELLE